MNTNKAASVAALNGSEILESGADYITSSVENISPCCEEGSAPNIADFLKAFYPSESETIYLRLFTPKDAPDHILAPGRFTKMKQATARRQLTGDTPVLRGLHKANQTHGIYFVVNAGGHEDSAINRYNAFFAECDTLSIEEQNARLDAGPLLPSIRVRTRKSIHAHWLIEGDVSAEDWREVQGRLIFHFGGDETIKNPSRVMRLPFFNHVKYLPAEDRLDYTSVTLEEFEPQRRYTLEQMLAAFPAVPARATTKLGAGDSSPTNKWAASALKYEVANVVTAHNGTRNDTLNKAAYALGQIVAGGALDFSTVSDALERAAIGAGLPPSEAQSTIKSGLDAGTKEPRVAPEKERTLLDRSNTRSSVSADNSHTEEEQGTRNAPETTIRAARMSDVHALPVDWLWRNRIALHALTIVEGIEGVGKSTLLTALAAAITTGAPLPQDERNDPGSVLWLSAEDDLARVLKPRLEAALADCSRVYAVGEPFRFDERGVLALRELVAEHRPRLVIIDPIFAYTQGDANKGNDARALTGELKTIAEQFEAAIALVRHVGKAKGMGDPRAAGLYSIEWRAAARSVLLVGADPDNPAKCAIAQTKNNLGPLAESLGYSIIPDDSSPSGARFWWTGESDLTAARILAPKERPTTEGKPDDESKAEAEQYLREVLADGPVSASDVKEGANAYGITAYKLQQAKLTLKIKVQKEGGRLGEKKQRWTWSLPTPEDSENLSEEFEEF